MLEEERERSIQNLRAAPFGTQMRSPFPAIRWDGFL